MILSSILTTKCYYHYPGKSNEQTLHEETTYSCWHAGTNNEQTSLRTTAPIFQSQTVWSVAALTFWKTTVPIVKFWCYPPKTLVIWYHVTSWWETICWLGWYQKILMISPEFMAGNVLNFCWNFDESILMISLDRSDNPHKLLMIIPMISLERLWWDAGDIRRKQSQFVLKISATKYPRTL